MVLNTGHLIEQIESLPVEGRAQVIDALLRSLNQPDTGVDQQWVIEARRRLEELRSDRVQGVPADQVFADGRERFPS